MRDRYWSGSGARQKISAMGHVNEQGESQDAPEQKTENGDSKQRMGAGEMRHQQATNWHGDRANNERPGSNDEHRTSGRQTQRGKVEKQIHRAQAEERDMGEPIKPAFETGVAAEPVLMLEKQAQNQPRNEAEQDSGPGGDEIKLHPGCFLTHLTGQVLIDKT